MPQTRWHNYSATSKPGNRHLENPRGSCGCEGVSRVSLAVIMVVVTLS